ncbi:tetratricopeptide repeat protein [Heliobacterium gestii]|uniref:Tetratricopeptide repeat protein n=1 Tax=Heliomicrobium gestii TaxID=2699 RepID=A0A845LAZ7_HELGE|nr:tetratricopeptide repeat protein [Heliomicrobium gestii]MBM7866190.1 tetratricopeptide (TPR) repeat protein [Heliomicrobium gestii]MZP42484.1 tetratricopeptide repeat protein [Heliomicrobium gestii]
MAESTRFTLPRVTTWSGLRDEPRGAQRPAIALVPAPSRPAPDDAIAEGAALHRQAMTGDPSAIQKALAYFEKLRERHPADDRVTAYFADCQSMTGSTVDDSYGMFKNAIPSIKLLDQAVENRPDDMEIRLLRAYQSFRLHEGFFRRTSTAIGDFEAILSAWDERRFDLSPERRKAVLFDLGCAYHRLGMTEAADETWNRLLSLDGAEAFRRAVEKARGDFPADQEAELLALTDKADLLQEGIRLFEAGAAGDRGAARVARDLLKKAHAADPEDPLALAYAASATALTEKDAIEPNALFGSAIRTMKALREAKEKAPENPRIRLLRAYLAYSLPEAFFHTAQTAIQDLRFVLEAYEKDPALLSGEEYARVLHHLGQCYRRSNNDFEAKKIWSRLLADCPDSSYCAAIPAALREEATP